MDALPIVEETGAEYASQNNGVMHACGHDGHTAIGLTVARILLNHRDEVAGTIKFCFQPSEEGFNGEECGGNEMMMRDGVLESPHVDRTLALHLWNDKPVGWVGVGHGPVMAGAEQFAIKLTGRGGHGAAPHLTIDPIVAAAQIVTTLQTITSRNVAPLEAAVVSVTTLHSGTAFNVIPQEAELTGTIRTFDPAVRTLVLERFDRIVRGVAETLGCQVETEVVRVTPAVINNDFDLAYGPGDRKARPALTGPRDGPLHDHGRRGHGLHAGEGPGLLFLCRIEQQGTSPRLRSPSPQVRL